MENQAVQTEKTEVKGLKGNAIETVKLDRSPLSMTIKKDIAVLCFDDPHKKVNTLNSSLLPLFEKYLDKIEKNEEIKGIVILSGKKDCFIAGADIEELQAAKSVKEAQALSRKGQLVFERLSKSSKPVVAAISGSCLGGGMELALACHYRIARVNSKTSLGLPEVMLGLLPGAGGTQRLPRLIGLEKSLKMMLTGAPVDATRAYKMGLVDYITHSESIEGIAIDAAIRLSSKTLKRRVRKKKGFTSYLEATLIGREFMIRKAREGVMEKTKGLYPAPLAILDLVSYGMKNSVIKGLVKESEEFARLSQTPEAKGLMSLYFAQTETKKNRFGEPKKPVENLAVLGAGLMGAGIASVSIQKNFFVRLKDLNMGSLSKAKKSVWKELSSKVKRKKITPFQRNQILSQLAVQVDNHQFSSCDMVIEAVFEDMKLKHKVLQDMEAALSPKAVFASNTSALPISEIARVAKHPERVVGMHYFSPVSKMPLLEIISTEQSSQEALSRSVNVGHRQGKTVIVVKDGPGFYTTRILAPYMDEAAIVLLEGVDIKELDETMLLFGFPVGPIKLLDEVGIDVACHIQESLGEAFGTRVSSGDDSLLQFLSKKNFLGRKTGKGCYIYEGSKGSGRSVNRELENFLKEKQKNTKKKSEDVRILQKRLAYRMMNEAVHCLEDGILSSSQDGDIGAVFGLGFPPFLGGPFHYINTLGVQKFRDELKRFADAYGERFTPPKLLEDMAREGKNF